MSNEERKQAQPLAAEVVADLKREVLLSAALNFIFATVIILKHWKER